MAFTISSPVAAGNYGLVSQYQTLWDNTQFLHTNILRTDTAASVIIGELSRVDIKQIGRAARDLSVDILAGTTAAAGDTDAQIIICGASNAASYSGVFQARTSANQSWLFVDDDRSATWIEISGTPTTGVIGRPSDAGSLTVRGGPDANDAMIQLRGESTAGSISGLFRARLDNSAFGFLRNDDATVVAITASTGATTFYNPDDATDYVKITGDSSPSIVMYQGAALKLTLDTGGAGSPYLRANVTMELQAAAGAVSWQFTSTGALVFVNLATASAPTGVEGSVYYDTTLNKLRVYTGAAYETITSA